MVGLEFGNYELEPEICQWCITEVVPECEPEPDAALARPGLLIVSRTEPFHRSVAQQYLSAWPQLIVFASSVTFFLLLLRVWLLSFVILLIM